MHSQVKQHNDTAQQVFVGIDVHAESLVVSTCTSHSSPSRWPVTIQRPFTQNLIKYLKRHHRDSEFLCVYEAGFSGYWLHYELEALGIRTLVAHAADVPTTDKERNQKEDKRDARKLTQELKNGRIKGIYVPPLQQCLDRSVVRERYTIAKCLRRIKAQIKSHLALYNVRIPADMKKHWSNRLIHWLEDKQLERSDQTMRLQLERLHEMRGLKLMANRSIRAISQTDRYRDNHQILITAPGIGTLTSMLLLTEIIDMNRFPSSKKLLSYVGLVPRMKDSGVKERQASITNRKHNLLRSALVESSWSAKSLDPYLSMKYDEYRRRMTAQRAIIRIARIFTKKIRHMWLNKEPYMKGEI